MERNRESIIQADSNHNIQSMRTMTIAIMVFVAVPAAAHAEEKSIFDGLTLGLGVNYSDEGYVGYDSEVLPIPFISYESRYFSIDGMSIAGNILNNKNHRLSVIVSYDGMSFDPDKAKGVYSYLEERKNSILAGGAYAFTWNEIISIAINVQTDISDKHNGTKAEIAFSSFIPVNRFLVIPTIGVGWANDKYNRYYYGVSSAETAKTGLPPYRPEESIQPFIGIGCIYTLSENWEITADLSASYNPDEIYGSPMIDEKIAYSSTVILSYAF